MMPVRPVGDGVGTRTIGWLKLAAASAVVIAGLGFGGAGHAEAPVLRIGVMNDKQGPYSDAAGVGSDIAGRLAVEDMHGQAGPFRVELSGFDHQNKPDIGVGLAKKAYEQDRFAALFDISHSAVSLAVQSIARQDNKVLVFVGSALPQLFGAACSPTSAMWLYDLDQQSRAIVAGDPAAAKAKWFMLGSDYVSGKENVEILRRLVTQAGGTVTGSALTPLGESDYSSVLLRAQSSGATVIAITYPGNDLVNAVKQAREFGVSRTTKLMTPFIYVSYAKALGPEAGAGLQSAVGYYWNRDAASRAFADRFAAATNGRRPSQVQAGVYSAVLHYLRAVAATGTDDGAVVMAKMKELPVDDFFAEGARVREDGRLMKDSFEVEIADAASMTDPWDVFKVLRRIPATDIIVPPDGSCHLPK